MKKRTIMNMVGLFLVFLVFAIAPSITNSIPVENHAEIVYPQNLDENDYIPANPTLNHLNSEEIVGEPNVVEYDVKTGIETEYSVDYEEIHSMISSLEPYLGILQDEPIIRPTLGPEDLVRVYDTTEYPYSAVVKILVDENETHSWQGSGAMISEKHVLTAGHMVYSFNSGWFKNIRVIPGKDGIGETSFTEPYGRAYGTHIRSTTGWTQYTSSEHDWAVITLDEEIGIDTGWLGVLALPDGHNNFSDRVYTAGYPATYKEGYYMYKIDGIGGYADEFNHHYTFYGEGGQSGSSVWTLREDDPYAISIYAYGPSPGFGTRITQEKFDLLNLWIQQDNSDNPQPDLEITRSNNLLQALDSNKYIVSLFTGIPISTTVTNYGGSFVEKVTLAFYLSEDEDITKDDYLIGKTTLKNIGGFESVDVEKTVRVPLRVPAGYYEIGWIIDPEDEVDEFLETNNAYLNGLQLKVITSFLNVSIGLWLGIIIGAAVLAIAIPTVVSILVKRKRIKQ